MRYIDTGARDPNRALGTYLSGVMTGPAAASELRVQTGFFGAGALGYFYETLQQLATSDGVTRLLVGSNDGETSRAALEQLLTVTGGDRANLKLGIVSFASGFFHPKVFHFRRADGTSTAYVGSANMTPAGTASKHVEAGIILDTRDGDSTLVLDDIADAIDQWFVGSPPGFYPLVDQTDLDPLVVAGVINATPPPRLSRSLKTSFGGHQNDKPPHSLRRLVAVPMIPGVTGGAGGATGGLTPTSDPGGTSSGERGQSVAPAEEGNSGGAPRTVVSPAPAAHWSKSLPRSDAQRKAAGNQSGAVALTQGDYAGQIDQTTYFRQTLFGTESWTQEIANTGQPKEVANVPMRVSIDGVHYGELNFRISNASNRESGQNNYTAQLHLEPITALFSQSDMTGRKLEIERQVDGSFDLRIS